MSVKLHQSGGVTSCYEKDSRMNYDVWHLLALLLIWSLWTQWMKAMRWWTHVEMMHNIKFNNKHNGMKFHCDNQSCTFIIAIFFSIYLSYIFVLAFLLPFLCLSMTLSLSLAYPLPFPYFFCIQNLLVITILEFWETLNETSKYVPVNEKGKYPLVPLIKNYICIIPFMQWW